MNLTLEELISLFKREGATTLLAKALAENDNSKQQVYLGGSFEVLTTLPFQTITAQDAVKRPNFKARISLLWLGDDGTFEQAPGAQLILYPDYPEVRLSGFLQGCRAAPSRQMQPVAREARGAVGAWDGRVLFFGVKQNGEILAVLTTKGSPASRDFEDLRVRTDLQKTGVLYSIPIVQPVDSKSRLLAELASIHNKGWVHSIRRHSDGRVLSYNAPNGGGYTLEALLGITPNGHSEPDYLGWELKAYSGDRITLMTPEPDAGFYGEHGVEAFLRNYGYVRSDGVTYFTGVHRAGVLQDRTQHELLLDGFDTVECRIIDVTKGIVLRDRSGTDLATWTYQALIEHWGRKHANAAYVKYERRGSEQREYRYLSPVLLGVGTDFTLFLKSISIGAVFYDPASKMNVSSTGRTTTKARNQFRVNVRQLPPLYKMFSPEPF